MCNGKYFGGGMRVGPDADISDGLFDCIQMENVGVWQAVTKISSEVREGTHIQNNENVTHFRAKKVHLEPVDPDDKIFIEADGDLHGFLPATFTMLHHSIQLIIP